MHTFMEAINTLKELLKEIVRKIDKAPTINPEDCRAQWISVEDRLPEYEHPVLATDVREDYTAILTLKAGGKVLTDCWEDAATGVRWPVDEMTHWMPLPEPPKGE